MSAPPTAQFQRVDSVFDAVLDLPTAEQPEFVDRACGDDAQLRADVLELLRAYHHSDSFLESPAVQIAAPILEAAAVLTGPVPDRIGPFRIVREIGRGGMGRVFLGERADGQFEQRVALKLIQHAAPGVVRRFVEERRILALLEHPGIARLVDGGISAGGLPYFAMELVEGEPIDRYCEARNLTLDRRLELFSAVCDAVSYAHQHLIIHRDLKPSNILVRTDGQVKLLDFGIAKLIGSRANGDATRTDLSVMTPEFAAPEQIRGTPISTATDVYSLGILLYILLTGKRPYDVRGKSPAEVERIVCEEISPKPSSQAAPPLQRRLRGDLDLIVMTALQKQEQRRYQSPAALAQDLQRFREGRAILARPDSVRYRLTKFTGRHRAGIAVGAAVVLGLVAAASRERVLRTSAEVQARKAAAVEDFLVRVFDVADPMAPRPTDGGSVTARELLDRGARRIDSTLAQQPVVQAELHAVLGRVYTNLGLFDKATPLLERSLAQRASRLGSLDAKVAASMDLLGTALMKQDNYDEALPLLRRALEQRRQLFGGRDSSTAESLNHLATLHEQRNEFDAAEPLYREALAIRQSVFGDSSLEVANSLNNLGVLLYRRGAYEAAQPIYQRSLDISVRRLGENHPLTAATMQNMAQILQAQGKIADAERYYRRSLAAKRKALGNAHPSVTISLNNLGILVRDQGRLEEAESLTREAISLDHQIFGDNHSYVAEGLRNLGIILRTKGELTESETVIRQALEMDLALFGEQHLTNATMSSLLAQTRYLLGDTDEAIRLTRGALAKFHKLVGDRHSLTLSNSVHLARYLTETGNAKEAESLLRTTMTRLDSAKAQHRIPYMSAQRTLGEAVLAQGRTGEALQILQRALEMSIARLGNDNWRTADAQLAYGNALVTARRYADAEPLLRTARSTLDKNRKAQPRLAGRADAALEKLRAFKQRVGGHRGMMPNESFLQLVPETTDREGGRVARVSEAV